MHTPEKYKGSYGYTLYTEWVGIPMSRNKVPGTPEE